MNKQYLMKKRVEDEAGSYIEYRLVSGKHAVSVHNSNGWEIVQELDNEFRPPLKVDDKIIVWDNKYSKYNRHFSHFDEDGKIVTFMNGATSFSTDGGTSSWSNWELYEEQTTVINNYSKSSFGELEAIPKEHRAMVIAIAMTESNCNYNVKHPTNETCGIGGIKPSQWTLKSKVNSLMAIDEIITKLEKRGMKPYNIIKYYKGGITNLKSTEQCFDLYKRLKGVL